MPQSTIFKWKSGNGWLVLSGGSPPEATNMLNIEAKILGRTVSQGPIAYIWAAGDIETADYHMESLHELGARTGYLVDILTERDETLSRQIGEAGVIILGDGPHSATLHEAMAGVVLNSIEDAFQRGATLYFVGHSAALMGTYTVQNDELWDGHGWLAHSIIMPNYTPQHAAALRTWVQRIPTGYGYGLGLGTGAALALGPQNEVETWGNAAITVTLASTI